MLESEIYNWLSKYDFTIPKYKSFKIDENPSLDFYPVALKAQSDKVVHKSDFNAVALSIPSDLELKRQKEKIIDNVAEKGIKLDGNDRFIATAMVKGVELFVGVVDDDIFGKVILFGKGGVFLEMYRDVCYIDLYADEQEIKRAILKTKISKIFDNFRGQKIDINIAVDFIKKTQKLVIENPDIKELDFNPVLLNTEGLSVVDSRIKKSDKTKENRLICADRVSFFDNRNVAIIGASSDETKVGYAIAKNSLNFKGNLFFVNQKGGKLFDRDIYKSINEIDSDIDTAVITVPAKFVLPIICDLIPKKLKNLIIITAGFKEIGDSDSEKKIAKLARENCFNVIGPNCLGYANLDLDLNLTFGTSKVHRGNLALLSQSGAVLSGLMDKAYEAGVGFSHVISAGNMVDINFGEMIDMLNTQKSCKYISVYAEGIQFGKDFLQSIRKSKKPVYIFKTGKSEASKKAAFSHTGNLSGNYGMFKGLLESVGSKIEDNIEALLFNPLNEVDNILIITNAGGPASILTDYIIDKGKKVYELNAKEIKAFDEVLPSNWPRSNPVDIIGDALSDRFENSLKIADEIEEVGLVYVIVTPQFMTDSLNIAKILTKNYKKKVIPIFLGGDMFQESTNYLISQNKMFFKSLQGATAFL